MYINFPVTFNINLFSYIFFLNFNTSQPFLELKQSLSFTCEVAIIHYVPHNRLFVDRLKPRLTPGGDLVKTGNGIGKKDSLVRGRLFYNFRGGTPQAVEIHANSGNSLGIELRCNY